MEVSWGKRAWMNSFPLLRAPRLADEKLGRQAPARGLRGQAGQFRWQGRQGTDQKRTIRRQAQRSDERAPEYGAGAEVLAAAARAQGLAVPHRERVRTPDRPRIRVLAPWVFPSPAASLWEA